MNLGSAAGLVHRVVGVIHGDGRPSRWRSRDPGQLDHLIPSPDAFGSGPARWRLASSRRRLYPPPAGRDALAAWHSADGATGDLRSEYLVGLWLLVCVTAAIDRLTVNRGAAGLVRDGAIELDDDQLQAFGLTPGRRRGGYAGAYWVFAV